MFIISIGFIYVQFYIVIKMENKYNISFSNFLAEGALEGVKPGYVHGLSLLFYFFAVAVCFGALMSLQIS